MAVINIKSMIEHTLLRPDATIEDIIHLCGEAEAASLCGVCVHPVYVELAANRLRGTGVKVVTVVGFPNGASLPAVKAMEARLAVAGHADEVDMVMNIAAAKNGQWDAVVDEIKLVVASAAPQPVKVIIETALLTYEEKRCACQAVIDGGAAFVKTSTGFAVGGATVEDVRLLATVAGDKIGIKASGGIRTREQALALVEAGAARIGTSAGPALAKGDA